MSYVPYMKENLTRTRRRLCFVSLVPVYKKTSSHSEPLDGGICSQPVRYRAYFNSDIIRDVALAIRNPYVTWHLPFGSRT
ncbi:hypothetical protein NP493_1243g00045 [Ridgeia piscesae]|uniref:Uncharacterized protein n=1 Tax=Ridgeia piscesae TaxID=27915 RepID=A0AAD9KAL3_RIDPI|nr:hypothetical protein NP493_1243g00045 [Ridgeia piscesae]